MTIRTYAQAVIPGLPPSPNELRGRHWSTVLELTKQIRADAIMLGQSGRNRAGWNLPVRTDPPTARYVAAWLFTGHEWDEDNLDASVKPVLDALKGILLVDDSPAWCKYLGAQQRSGTRPGAQRTVVNVYLADPRPQLAGMTATFGREVAP